MERDLHCVRALLHPPAPQVPPVKKLFILAVLALASGALACPVKPGYVANGLFKNTSKAAPICGPLYQAFKYSLVGVKWTEMYEVKNGRVGNLRTADFLALIQKRGYRNVKRKISARSQVYLFQRRNNSITAVIGFSAGGSYLGLAGQ